MNGVTDEVLHLEDLLADPRHVLAVIEKHMYGTTVDRWCLRREGLVLDLTFRALPGLAGFDDERARVTACVDGRVFAFPLGPRRTWEHRYPSPLGAGFGDTAGELCLFYPRDPRGLRWEWDDGFLAYLARVQRHLFFEEQRRRTGSWPVEDAPHGFGDGPHPIATAFMRGEERRWSRPLSPVS